VGLADGGKDKEQSRNKRDEYSSPFGFLRRYGLALSGVNMSPDLSGDTKIRELI
jgi:hypothetical protein